LNESYIESNKNTPQFGNISSIENVSSAICDSNNTDKEILNEMNKIESNNNTPQFGNISSIKKNPLTDSNKMNEEILTAIGDAKNNVNNNSVEDFTLNNDVVLNFENIDKESKKSNKQNIKLNNNDFRLQFEKVIARNNHIMLEHLTNNNIKEEKGSCWNLFKKPFKKCNNICKRSAKVLSNLINECFR